jgi:hypothetical protein
MGKSEMKSVVLVVVGVSVLGLLLGALRGNAWADKIRSGFAA